MKGSFKILIGYPKSQLSLKTSNQISEQSMVFIMTKINKILFDLQYKSQSQSKKIQQFQQQKKMNYPDEQNDDLQEIFDQVQYVHEQLYCMIVQLLRKEQISDSLGFLLNPNAQKLLEEQLKMHKEIELEKQNYHIITNSMKLIQNHKFNKNNYSEEIYNEIKEDLIKKISQNKKIIQFFQFLVLLTAIDNNFIQCGSNSLNLLVQIKVDLTNQNFENINIQNTSLVGANFMRCNLSQSQFDNVDISGINLNGAQLFNCKWKNLKIEELNNLNGHSSSVRSVCFMPDGSTLASSSYQEIRLWEVKTGQQKAQLNGHTGSVSSVCFSPDGTTLASGSWDNSIRLWDVQTQLQKAKFDGHSHYVMSVCFSPDGTTLASGSCDKSIIFWDVKIGEQKAKLEGHNHFVNSVCFSPDGTRLASGSEDKSIRLWDVKTGQEQLKINCHEYASMSICFSPDGTTLASGSYQEICLLDVQTGQQKAKLNSYSGEWVSSVCFSPSGTTLASGSYQEIRLWEVKTGQQKAQLNGHTGSVSSVCFSSDGTILASGSEDKSIRLWDIKTGQEQAKMDGLNHDFRQVCFSSDGTTLASCSDENFIRLWDVETGKEIQPSDKSYKDILIQFKTPLFSDNCLPATANITILLISQQAIFQAQGALILKGEFISQSGIDLKTQFKERGSCFLETFWQK